MTEGEIDKDSVKLPCTMIRPTRTLWRSTGRASHVRRWLTEIGESSGKISAFLIRVWMWQGRLCHTETGRKLLCLKSSWSLSKNWYAPFYPVSCIISEQNTVHLDLVTILFRRPILWAVMHWLALCKFSAPLPLYQNPDNGYTICLKGERLPYVRPAQFSYSLAQICVPSLHRQMQKSIVDIARDCIRNLVT